MLLLLVANAAAEEQRVRIGTIIPEGTPWARELKALQRDAESAAGGDLHLKWYLGGIAGDELEMAERVRRDQLDGVLSGGMLCERLAPSMRVIRIPGLLQTWEETAYVLGRLRGVFEKEAQQGGFAYIAETIVGPSIVFARSPVNDLADLKKSRFWVWDTDTVLRRMLPEIGVSVVPLPINDAGRAYDAGQIDGFITPAAAALGFQWSARVRYHADLRMGFIAGCLLVANRAFDALPRRGQQALRDAAAKTSAHWRETGRAQEEELLGGLFRRQGVRPMAVSNGFRGTFLGAARTARERVGAAVVPDELTQRVLSMLADFRAERLAP
ncbi:MAG: TRAP-type C4-dicarboxylate transporter, periplasmic component [Myxococcales bacterium]|nr:TRAP-type C4-dicarboxylate transporter, periplasmic component [Myxococcales bacterium]